MRDPTSAPLDFPSTVAALCFVRVVRGHHEQISRYLHGLPVSAALFMCPAYKPRSGVPIASRGTPHATRQLDGMLTGLVQMALVRHWTILHSRAV